MAKTVILNVSGYGKCPKNNFGNVCENFTSRLDVYNVHYTYVHSRTTRTRFAAHIMSCSIKAWGAAALCS